MGALVLPIEEVALLEKDFLDVRAACGIRNANRPLHFNELNHKARIKICEKIAGLGGRIFWVASHKTNMRGYLNPRAGAITGYNFFYNWIARLLLERISEHCHRHSTAKFGRPRVVKLCFASRTVGMKAELRRYLSKLKRQSERGELYIDAGDITWPVIDDQQLDFLESQDVPGLQFADTVASALYRALPERRGRTGNSAFIDILRPRAAKGPHGKIFGHGLKMMPKYQTAEITEIQRKVFESFGAPRLTRKSASAF